MAMKCNICGREFKNERALNIHLGRMHGSKKKKDTGPTKSSDTSNPKAVGGKFICPVCGRSFGMAMHLARHMTAIHGKTLRKRAKTTAKSKAVRKRTRKLASTTTSKLPKGLRISSLSVDELLAAKKAIDNQLKSIVQKIRAIKIGK